MKYFRITICIVFFLTVYILSASVDMKNLCTTERQDSTFYKKEALSAINFFFGACLQRDTLTIVSFLPRNQWSYEAVSNLYFGNTPTVLKVNFVIYDDTTHYFQKKKGDVEIFYNLRMGAGERSYTYVHVVRKIDRKWKSIGHLIVDGVDPEEAF